MPSIALRKEPGLYPTHSGFVGVYEERSHSNLFIKYTHRPVTHFKPENIYLYAGNFAFMNVWGSYATLQPQGNYYGATLKLADVYFNRFDSTSTPLACVLKFHNKKDGKTVQDRIYIHSDHGYLINQSSNAPITTLTEFDTSVEQKLLELLIEESDKHLNSVTYELDQINTEQREKTYNSDKITLSTKQTLSTDHKNEFYKYNHSYRYKRPKKSLLLYKNNAPMFDRQHFVQNIQAQDYDNVNVYYSTKLNTPLLIELINKRKKTHLQRINTDESKWTITHIAGYNEDRLVNYLRTVFRFVEEKQVEEQKKKQKEQQKREQQQQTGQETVRGPGAGSSQGTHGTTEQGSQTTQAEHAAGGTSSSGPSGPGTSSLGQTSTSTGKICVLIDKQQTYQKSEVNESCKTTGSKAQDVQPTSISVRSSDFYGTDYKIYTHDIKPNSSSLGGQQNQIELTIYISTIDISLFNSGGDRRESLMYNSRIQDHKLNVYFYEPKNQTSQEDKIPLMFHYDGKFYRPSERDYYFTGWRRINDIRDAEDIFKIKNQLDRINKELNRIELDFKPGTNCSYGLQKATGVQITEFSTDRIKVKVEQIGSTDSQPPPSPSSNGSCPTFEPRCPYDSYVKYTHTTINKFQLGSIYYKSNLVKVIQESQLATTPGNPISTTQTQNLVSVYYWINDTKLSYPLFIAIGRQNGGPVGSNVQGEIDQYYKLISTGASNYKWQKLSDQEKPDAKGPDNKKLVELLDKINYAVKKVIKILLDKQNQYELCYSSEPGGANGGYTPYNGGGKQIQVEACSDDNGCSKLSDRGYKCFVHNISKLNGQFDYNSIGGLKFFISGKNGSGSDNDFEIKLYNSNGDSGGSPLEPMTYNTCMGDVYVFFYCKPSCPGPSPNPTAPLMLYYNKNYYKPENIDHYFQKWVCEKGLATIASQKPCGGDNGGSTTLAGSLDDVNRALNRIKLTETSFTGGTNTSGLQYGISAPTTQPNDPNIKLERIKVTKQDPKPGRPYCKLVHRTMNSFDIGEIWYKNQDIKTGVQINGGPDSIKVGNGTGNHTNSFVTSGGTNKPNTVVAYYHKDDGTYKLPQLIVLMETSEPISATKTITASRDTNYGYYVLATTNGAVTSYKYEWRQPEDSMGEFKLDDQTEFKLLNSIIILVEKQKQYDEGAINSAVKNLQNKSPGNLNGVNRLKNRDINVSDQSDAGSGESVKKYNYKLLEHDLTKATAPIFSIHPILGLRFLIPSETTKDGYNEISLYNDEEARLPVGPLYHTSTQATVYVYFYDRDPRPLLLCFGNDAYIPKKNGEPTPGKQVDVDYTKWTLESKIKQCTCTGKGTESPNKEILDALNDVTGFLNPVQINPKQIPDRASRVITTNPSSTEYNLHQYKYSSYVKMKITRESVECYEKYTYQPAGINGSHGKNGEGFRLGNVIYISVNSNKPAGTVKYTGTANQHKYDALKTVDVYYYDQDVGYSDPLLVVLHFEKIPSESNDAKEYWKLIKNDGISPGNMKWTKDADAQTQIGNVDTHNQKLVNYLDSIRYSLKKVVMIQISKNELGSYQLKGRPVNGSIGSGFGDIGSDSHIQVVECDDSRCTKLKANHYTCFQHKISDIEDSEQHQIGGLAMTLPGQGDQVVEIPLHSEEGTNISHITYNTCMGDVYVYFYCKKDGSNDNVPLMLRYNDKFYEPEKRDNYFTKWEEESSLHSIIKGPCGDNGKYQALSLKLDTINKALNRIELTHDLGGKSNSKYGLPSSSPTSRNFNKNRVDVVKKPNNDESNRPYVKIAHRTINDFRIGDIYYGSDEIVTNGVKLNGTTTASGPTIINIDKNGNGMKNHRDFADTNNPNTVVVYYSITDETYKLPQLILLLQTADSIDEDAQVPITASDSTKYGYYILATGTGGLGYQYEWREPDGQGVSLDEKTELSLLNSVVILVEQKPPSQSGTTNNKYGDEKIDAAIKKAIESKSLQKSPGLSNNDINRLKGKDITPTDETEKATGTPTLKDTGFRVISHNMTEIVAPKILGPPDVTLIAILRFLIPTPEGGGEYRLLSLYDPDARDNPITLFHQKTQNSVYVYFYDPENNGKGDPRPLLLCYNNKAFRAFNIFDYDCHTWYKAPKVENCFCDKKFDNNLLVALVRVSNFLNPVKIERTINGKYVVHKFNGQEICIKLDVTKSNGKFCYHKYTHKHNGMRKSNNGQNTRAGDTTNVDAGKGFRLGSITYLNKSLEIVEQPPNSENKPVKLISSLITEKPKYDPASEVVVYYYRGDKTYKNPLLVVLCKNGNCSDATTSYTCKPYYELQRPSTKTDKKYKKESNNLSLDPRKNGQLEQILDRILFSINNSLQIDLSFRNTVKPKSVETPKKQCITTSEGIYKARVYDNELGKPKKSTHTIGVNVCGPTQILDPNKQETGYLCYRHRITGVDDVSQINGLRLFLWDNRNNDDDDDSECKGPKAKFLPKRSCCEITLVNVYYVEELELKHIPYTTCKGDLYVYFYGSDPRPMLLCYNGQSYAPQSLDEYNQKWCRVSSITSCECDKTGFQASKELLNTLYKTSMFLNPVNLWETMAAHKKVKDVIDPIKKAKKEGKEVPKIGKLPEHVYTVQTFGDTEIRVRVKTSDLQCYRKYTHTPAMAEGGTAISRGYRLGSIFYGSDEKSKRDADSTCLKYPQDRRLQSVSLYYYMYDSDHRYPLIIQLDYGFGGELDDYYRVCKIGTGAGQGVGAGPGVGGNGGGPGGAAPGHAAPPPKPAEIAKAITWVKMKEQVEGSTQAQAGSAGTSSSGSANTCDNDCPSPTDYTGKEIDPDIVKELKENDARFVKEAHQVQIKSRALSLGEHPLFGQQYLDLVAELQALIEARCFDVRRKYGIEFPKGEKNKNLILVSDENCYEESIMGYLLGGGALGVAGGGGWKLATFVLTLFIKV